MDPKFYIRELQIEDYDRGYVKLLSNLTDTGNISKDDFTKRFALINQNQDYSVKVVLDKENDKIVGSGTLFIEHKFIHSCADKGHIEDIVVDSEYRSQKIGGHIITNLVDEGRKRGVYKISLVCREEVEGLYAKFGFEPKEKEMVMYLKK